MKGQKSHNATNCNYNRIINKYIITKCQKKIKIIEQYKPDANKPSRISGFRLRGNRQATEKEREIISVGSTECMLELTGEFDRITICKYDFGKSYISELQ
jgi:hypothetical protein